MGEKEEIARILRLQSEWMEAWVHRNLKTLERILAEDFVMTTTTTDDLVDRETWLRAAMGGMRAESFHFDEIHIQLYRDSAVVHSRFMQKASLDGKEWNGEFLVSDAWVHDRGDWRVACRHMSQPSGVRTKGQLGEPR